MIAAAALLLGPGAFAQEYRFAADPSQVQHWYPTAYMDHGGVDWACGSIRYNGHRGSDFGGGGFAGMDAGRQVRAAAPGVVVTVVDGEFDRCTSADCPGGGGFGNYVRLDHPDGRSTFYAHLKKWSVAVAEGQAVACGDLLGEMGSSGFSTGPHLHFEVRDADANRLDPFVGSCSPSAATSWVDQGAHGAVPGLTCDAWPACEPAQELTCGARIESTNAAPGSTNTHQRYGCGTWAYTGPEIAYSLRTDRDETVSIRLSGLAADLDVYLLEDAACDMQACLAASDGSQTTDESLDYPARAGEERVLVIDGFRGVTSPFVLEVICEGTWPPPEPPDTGGEDSAVDTSAPDSGDSAEPNDDTAVDEPAPGRCGCEGTGGAAFGASALVFLVGRRRMRAGGAGAWRSPRTTS